MAKQLPVFPSRVAGKFMVRTFGQLTTVEKRLAPRFTSHRCGSFLERLRRAENSTPRQAWHSAAVLVTETPQQRKDFDSQSIGVGLRQILLLLFATILPPTASA